MNSVFDILRHIVDTSNLFAPSQKEEAHKIIDAADPDSQASGNSGNQE